MSKIRSSVLTFVFVALATFFVTPTAFAADSVDRVDLGDIVAQIVDQVVEMIAGDDAEDESQQYIDPLG